MPEYRRFRVPGGTYFFTVAAADRRSSLLTDHVRELRLAFRATHRVAPFAMKAIVVLPDHLHCIWTLPPGDDDFPARWARIKSLFSRSLAATGNRTPSHRARRERGLWQRRF